MSENGPREGTRDLPRPSPESGRRAVEEDSPAGLAYGTLSRSLRRRRAELALLAEEGGTPESVVARYQDDHPLEPAVTVEEIAAAVAEARAAQAARSKRVGAEPRRRGPARGLRT